MQAPDIVLLDFGRTFYDLHPDRTPESHGLRGTDNPILYRIPNDSGRYPPEALFNHPRNTRITSKSDVWSIGALVFSLITHHISSRGPYLDDGMHTIVNTRPYDPQLLLLMGGRWAVSTEDNGPYMNSSLFPLLRSCLAYDPAERPSLIQLKQLVAGHIDTLVKKGVEFEDPQLHNPNPFEAYEMGKTRPYGPIVR